MHMQFSTQSNGQQVSVTSSSSGTHSLWPVDTAIVPAPTVFLATADNSDAYARLPVSAVQDVSADPDAANRFTVTVPEITEMGAVQLEPTLCWAACTQTLLKQQEIQVDQKLLARQFVPDTNDDDDEQTAGIGVVTRALNPDLAPQVEQRGAIPISLVSVTTDQMINELLAGRLCMVGLVEDKDTNMGHACVVCGATFSELKPSATSGFAPNTVGVNPNIPQTQDDQSLKSHMNPVYGLYEVEIFDPEPKVGTRKLTAQQFCDQVAFITSHQISHNMLEDALRAPDDGAVNFNKVLVVKSKNRQRARVAIMKMQQRPGSVVAVAKKPAQMGSGSRNKEPAAQTAKAVETPSKNTKKPS